MDQKIISRLQKAIEDHVFPGCVLGIVWKNGDRKIFPVGRFTYEPDSNSVKEDTIFDLASVTKSIPGSSSLLKLVDEGKLSLEDRLVDFVPEFGNFENKKEVKIKHLLTYTLDLEIPAMSTLKDKNADELMDVVMKAPLRNPPGSTYVYVNSTAGFASLVVEKVSGKTLDKFADENFFVPLKMNRTTFFPEKLPKNEFAPTEIDDWRERVIQGEVHDESTFILRKKYMTAAAGLFSTAPDLLNFLEMLLNKGKKDGSTYFSEKIIEQMHTNQFPDLDQKIGLGWVVHWREATGTKSSEETFTKSGFTGTSVTVDPTNGIAFTLLSNRTYPKRPKDTSAILEVRRDIADIIF